MRKMQFWLAVAMVVAIAGSGAIAATDMWLTTDGTSGAKEAGDKVTATAGDSITLHCFIDSTDIGNTFEVMVGYDKSTADTYGGGVGTWVEGKLALLSTPAVEASIPTYFDVLRSVVLDASGREDQPNKSYGFVARGATHTNATISNLKCFSFTLVNQMLNIGESQQVVISFKQGGNSYSSAWKHGTSLKEKSYVLTVESLGSTKPTVGISNKAVLDAIMTQAAPNYVWVLWGKVKTVGTGSFTIDDGSGVIITVNSSETVLEEDYVAVRGTLNPTTKTLTSLKVTKYN